MATELQQANRRGCHSDLSWQPLNSNDIHTLPHAVNMNRPAAITAEQGVMLQTKHAVGLKSPRGSKEMHNIMSSMRVFARAITARLLLWSKVRGSAVLHIPTIDSALFGQRENPGLGNQMR